MKERVESKSTTKLDAVGEGDIIILSIRKGGKKVGDGERFNNIVLEVLRRRLFEISHSLMSLSQL